MRKLSPVPKVLSDSLTPRSQGGSRGLRDERDGESKMKWEEVEENVGAQCKRLCERLLNSRAAQLSSWTRHRQDSEKNAKCKD